MTQERKYYSKRFKVDTVKLIKEQGYKVSAAPRNLGLHHSSLRRWGKHSETNGNQAFPGKGNLNSDAEELCQLRKEVKKLQMEREILKRGRYDLKQGLLHL